MSDIHGNQNKADEAGVFLTNIYFQSALRLAKVSLIVLELKTLKSTETIQ